MKQPTATMIISGMMRPPLLRGERVRGRVGLEQTFARAAAAEPRWAGDTEAGRGTSRLRGSPLCRVVVDRRRAQDLAHGLAEPMARLDARAGVCERACTAACRQRMANWWASALCERRV